VRLVSIVVCCCGVIQAQPATITGNVSVVRAGGANAGKPDNSNAVVWLKAVHGLANREGQSPGPRPHFKIVQQHKRFEPRLLAVPVGSVVDFPNLDPFFHNVFSMFDGKRFDLGLYEAGASHGVMFDKEGVSYIFCNIHPEMSAVVVAVDSPYYAISNPAGEFSFANVPPGRYLVSVWHERGKPEAPGDVPREVTISAGNAALPVIRLVDSGRLVAPHKNKYGRDYDRSDTPGPIYK
jgi:plastocyanin